MGKYDHLKVLKKTKSRTYHTCSNCGRDIMSNEIYYREHIEDRFLHSLHAKKFCLTCYEKFGDGLLTK